ncbi:hypothetical protein [Thiocapsa roseopersicina]|uniref:Extensin-like protein C-terminus n=1 Tax=Thiocapsa roseopersicina TaxID=1058 RepID=A0A1H3B8Q9_THIRO|nr:hypothetical protein [Thiocapsa roseopersicina]SDX38031.1 hypothetical protein SAMN05421783_12341 [Thiocapsa roseopersicina]
MACTKPNNTFKTLGGGVPVHYDRMNPPFHYGSKGKQFTLAAEKSLENLLDAAFAELWQKCPLGKADIILTAGAFVCKSGQHGKGRAFDCDGIWWGDRLLLTKNYRADSQAYLGVEAILRKHIGTVLNFEYNRSHEDHWHLDTGTKPGFSASSKSRVLFLQMALGKLFGRRVDVDGRVGDETRGAVRDVLEALGLATAAEMSTDNKTDKELARNWMAFLDAAAERGLATLAPPGAGAGAPPTEPDPLQLLARLHDLLKDELEDHPARKEIERAVENFAEHPEIDAVLARFQ